MNKISNIELELENVYSAKYLKITPAFFDGDLSTIIGYNHDQDTDNGVGKTTLAKILYYALTGKTLTGAPLSSITHHSFQNEGHCLSIKFTLNESTRVKIKRFRDWKANAESKLFDPNESFETKGKKTGVKLYINDSIWGDTEEKDQSLKSADSIKKSGVNGTDTKILNLLGASPNLILMTLFSKAGVGSRFLSENDTERANIISEFMDFDDIIDALQTVSEDLASANKELTELEVRLNEKTNVLLDKKRTLENEKNNIQVNKEKTEKEIVRLKEELSAIEAAGRELKEKGFDVVSTEQLEKDLEIKLKEEESIREKLLVQENDTIESVSQTISALNKDLNDIRTEIQKKEISIKHYEESSSNLLKEIEKIDKNKLKLERDDLILLGAKKDDDIVLKDKALVDSASRLESLKRELSNDNLEITKLDSQIESHRGRINDINSASPELKIKDIEAVISSLLSQGAKKLDDYNERVGSISTIKVKISEISKLRDDVKEKIGANSSRINVLNDKVKTVEAKKLTYNLIEIESKIKELEYNGYIGANKLDNKDEVEKQCQHLKTKISNSKHEKSLIEKEINEIQHSMSCPTCLRLWDADTIKQKEETIAVKNNQIYDIDRSLTTLSNELNYLVISLENHEHYLKTIELQKKIDEYKACDVELEVIRHSILDVEASSAELNKTLNDLYNKTQQFETELNSIDGSIKCHELYFKVEDNLSKIDAIKLIIKEKESLDVVIADKLKIKESIAVVLNEKLQKIENVNSEIAKLKKIVDCHNLYLKIEAIDGQLANVNTLVEKQLKIVELNIAPEKLEMNNLMSKESKIIETKKESELLLSIEVNKLNDFKNILKEELKETQILTSKVRSELEDVRSSNITIESRKKELDASRLLYASKKKEIDAESKKLVSSDILDLIEAEIKTAQKNKEDLEESVRIKQEDIEYLEFCKEEFGPAGIRSFISDDILDIVNEKVSEYMDCLYDGAIGVKFLPQKTSAKGVMTNGISVQLTQNGYEQNAKEFSFGEEDRMSLAVDLAFRMAAMQYSGFSAGWMMFDEPLKGVCTKAQTKSVALLKKVAEETEQKIFIISHNPNLQQLISEKIKLEKKNDCTYFSELNESENINKFLGAKQIEIKEKNLAS